MKERDIGRMIDGGLSGELISLLCSRQFIG